MKRHTAAASSELVRESLDAVVTVVILKRAQKVNQATKCGVQRAEEALVFLTVVPIVPTQNQPKKVTSWTRPLT